jgi:hypothetical protein
MPKLIMPRLSSNSFSQKLISLRLNLPCQLTSFRRTRLGQGLMSLRRNRGVRIHT